MPLVYSVDWMACKDAKSYKKRIASLLVEKWRSPYSRMVGYMCGKIVMAIIWSNTMMPREARSNKPYVTELEDVAA